MTRSELRFSGKERATKILRLNSACPRPRFADSSYEEEENDAIQKCISKRIRSYFSLSLFSSNAKNGVSTSRTTDRDRKPDAPRGRGGGRFARAISLFEYTIYSGLMLLDISCLRWRCSQISQFTQDNLISERSRFGTLGIYV